MNIFDEFMKAVTGLDEDEAMESTLTEDTDVVDEADDNTVEEVTDETDVEEAVVSEPEVSSDDGRDNTEEKVSVNTESAETEIDNTVEETVTEDPSVEADAVAPAEESVTTEIEIDPESVLDNAMESMVLLDVLRETCTKDEYTQFLTDNATELELYGLIDRDSMATEAYSDNDDGDAAMEAKNIVRLNRDANIAREEARIAIGLAKKSKDQLYDYYKKYSGLKRKFRDKIYGKYGSKAKPLARKAVLNSRNRASVMNSKTGTTIMNKIDQRIKQLDRNGRNDSAVQKPKK